MTGDEGPEADEATQERVRRLLAEARHEAPVPDDVASRLDDALAALVAERTRSPGQVVADLETARRRRRRWTTGLVAAAATVVLGVSLPNLTGGWLSQSGSDESDQGGAADAPAAGSAQEESSRDFEGGDSAGGGGADGSAPGEAASPLLGAVELDPGRFKRDAIAARDRATAVGELAERPAAVCGPVPPGAELVLVVRYDGQDGYLVFEPDADPDRQTVTLYLCPGGVPARQAVVAGP